MEYLSTKVLKKKPIVRFFLMDGKWSEQFNPNTPFRCGYLLCFNLDCAAGWSAIASATSA